MDVRQRLAELARLPGATGPVISVYLNTAWDDEHQRDRTRVFLKTEIRNARAAHGDTIEQDLRWIEERARSAIDQSAFPGAKGVALFASHGAGLRETLAVEVPFEDAFVVADAPFLRPLATLVDTAPQALVVFVDGESARLIPAGPEGVGDELRLESDVPGHHRRGGWAQLAQGRYQRHLQDHRGRHLEAVVEALAHLMDTAHTEWIVVAGEPRTVAELRRHLPPPIAGRVAGSVGGTRYETAAALLERARPVLEQARADAVAREVDAVLTEAAKSGRAVSGLEATLDAVMREAVHTLYLMRRFNEAGWRCNACGGLQSGVSPDCRRCGGPVQAVELGAAMVDRVIATGGRLETIDSHDGLARAGSVAARLRYPT
jgi:peptide subunit release factor 1 (eRF1)